MPSPLGLVVPYEIGNHSQVDVQNTLFIESIFSGGENQAEKDKAATNKKALEGGLRRPLFSAFASSEGVVNLEKSKIHSNDIYDTSISSILEYFDKSGPSYKVTAADFAYLKKIGVYPNNRLIVARRFAGPVADDLAKAGGTPMSTLISWVEEGKAFISIDYNEEWVSADASFEGVLNDLGKDIVLSQDQGTQFGTLLNRGFDVLPFPGLSEGLQFFIMEQLGLSNIGFNSPAGNPNLIREAQRRSTLDKGSAGANLKGKFSITFEVEYEQKFINGVDPTVAYYDIIANALSFGTSPEIFQLTGGYGEKIGGFIGKMASGDPAKMWEALQDLVNALVDGIIQIAKGMKALMSKEYNERKAERESGQQPQEQSWGSWFLSWIPGLGGGGESSQQQQANQANIDQGTGDVGFNTLLGNIAGLGGQLIGSVVRKYRLRLMGVTQALTGLPSGHWHVTIGNPKRPIFCSGDMICTSVLLDFGQTLSFNDLPSTIKLTVKLDSARNLGRNEIFKKLTGGRGRIIHSLDYLQNYERALTVRNDLAESAQTESGRKLTGNAQLEVKYAPVVALLKTLNGVSDITTSSDAAGKFKISAAVAKNATETNDYRSKAAEEATKIDNNWPDELSIDLQQTVTQSDGFRVGVSTITPGVSGG